MFCKICGSELNEQAVVCMKCGCLVEKIDMKVGHNRKKDTKLAFCFLNYLTACLFCLTFAFFMLSLITSVKWLIACFVIGICNFLTATASFVLGFFNENKAKRILSDMLFMATVVALFVIVYIFVWFY